MADYYEQLGLTQDATEEEIKKAYRRLALATHPDRVPGKEEEFRLIQEAYDTLSDSEKRRDYDAGLSSLDNSLGHIERLARQGLRFHLVESPELYDHYAYINALFSWSGEKALVGGQDISEQYDTFWEMLNYVDYRLCRIEERLKVIYRRNPSDEVKAQLRFIELHLAKICAVVPVILRCENRKRLYDLAMGFNQSTEMLEIESLIGGRAGLIHHIKEQVNIDIATGIFALRDAQCLTPANFKQLTSIDPESDFFSLSMVLDSLLEVNLLTQANFERLMQKHQYALAIHNGLGRLERLGILNQKYFEIVVHAGKKAKSVGSAIGYLQQVGLLNDETLQVVAQKNMVLNIWPPLYGMTQSGELNEETSHAFLWTGPSELQLLTHRLDQMIAHGVYLISQDVEKGKTALLLGLELKKELKEFFERPPEEQKENLSIFKESFMHQLHSKDGEMGIHREPWKIIVANVAIAFTGIGLIVLGIQYALNKRCFFARTQREQLIEHIGETEWLSPACFGSSN